MDSISYRIIGRSRLEGAGNWAIFSYAVEVFDCGEVADVIEVLHCDYLDALPVWLVGWGIDSMPPTIPNNFNIIQAADLVVSAWRKRFVLLGGKNE